MLACYNTKGTILTRGIVEMMRLGRKLGALPSSHMHSIDTEGFTAASLFLDRARHLVLPAFVLGIASAASTARSSS